MPNINIDFVKGLVQKSGAGFGIDSKVEVNGVDTTLDATTFLTEIASAHEVTLPASAATGAIKVIINKAAVASHLVSTNTTLDANVDFNAIGDGAICIYDGTEWQVMRTNG
tara:strand:- start:937 stop:1269 length:333 start_codon:yes stop_codon:yes gene_type:complete